MNKDLKKVNEASSRLMLEEIRRRKIKVDCLNPYHRGNAFLELSCGNHIEYIYGTKSSLTSATADYICKNKMLTKKFLKKSGLSFVPGRLFSCADLAGLERYIAEIGTPFVLKKYDGSRGHLVFPKVRDFAEGKRLIEAYFKKEKYILIEKRFEGKEYRFLCSREKVLGVIMRDPANVTGDGLSTIRQLIEKKNAGRRNISQIKIDSVIQAHLNNQGLSLKSVLKEGERVYLRDNSNVSTGGDSTDLTEAVHPQLNAIAIAAIRSVPGLAYGGVDIMLSKDIALKPGRKSYAILEINSDPGITTHHFPCFGKSRNVAGEIVDMLFPETKLSGKNKGAV
jgi:glutamate--cysteine ligase